MMMVVVVVMLARQLGEAPGSVHRRRSPRFRTAAAIEAVQGGCVGVFLTKTGQESNIKKRAYEYLRCRAHALGAVGQPVGQRDV